MAVPFFGATVEESKANLFRLLGYKITRDPRSPQSCEVVKRFHLSEARELIVSAPARTSKSWSAGPEIVHDFFPMLDEKLSDLPNNKIVSAEADLHLWIVPPVYKLAKEWKYAREYLLDRGLVKAFGGKVETNTDAESQGNMQLTVLWPWRTADGRAVRSTLQVRSAANENLLQAEEVKLAVMSEAADQDERIVKKFLSTRCRRIIYPTTPKRAGLWLWERIQRGIAEPKLRTEHFQFDRFCNPTYDHSRYDQARLEATMTYGSPEADPDFMEQYEGQWTFSGGQVVPFRWLKAEGAPPPNVVDSIPSWVSGATWYVTFDYGWDDPAVALFVAISAQGEMMVGSEIYQQHLTDEDLIERVKGRAADLGITVAGYIPDPQRPVLTELLRRRGLPLFDRAPLATLRDRPAGFQALRSAFSVDPAVGRPRLTILASCVRTITELKNIRFKEGMANEFSTQAIVGDDHACFTADTLIMTDRGLVPICDVKQGDYAMTRAGLRRVEAAWCDGEQEVVEAKFSDGRSVTVTGNHPIWSKERGWTRVDALRYGETCAFDTAVAPSHVLSGSDTCAAPSTDETCTCTARSGKMSADPSHRTSTFTTETVTPPTTESRISKRSEAQIISRHMPKRTPTFSARTDTGSTTPERGALGTPAQQASIGTESMAAPASNALVGTKDYASPVETSSKTKPHISGSARMPARASTEDSQALMTSNAHASSAETPFASGNTAPSLPVLGSVALQSVVRRSGRRLVYNLSVEDRHEYFANGVLAKNCDALRYFVMSRVKAKSTERDWVRDWQREQVVKQRLAKARTRYGTPLVGHNPGAFVEAR